MSDEIKKHEHEHEIGGQPRPQIGESSEYHQQDAVFGELHEDGPNYRNIGWLGTVAIMMKLQLGLGVLSLPSTFSILGMIPGVICTCAMAAITTWSAYTVGTFKLRHRGVYAIDDVGAMMFGRFGRIFYGVCFCLLYTLVAGSGMVGTSTSLNALSSHSLCTAIFVAIAAVVGFGLSSIQTLGRISWLAWVGTLCILASVMTVTIAIGVQKRPASAATDEVWASNWKLVNNPSFADATAAIATLTLSYASSAAMFSIIAEMRDPRHFSRSLFICQGALTGVYLVVACVIYYYCGSQVASPALGSTGLVVKRICYGFALPGLIVSTCIMIHLPAKYIFVQLLRTSTHLTSNTVTHWTVWLGSTLSTAVLAYIIASAVPVFSDLVSLVGALFCSFMSFQTMGCMWFYDNWSRRGEYRLHRARWARWALGASWAVLVILLGSFITICGTYGSVVQIQRSYRAAEGGSKAWSCADNSGL